MFGQMSPPQASLKIHNILIWFLIMKLRGVGCTAKSKGCLNIFWKTVLYALQPPNDRGKTCDNGFPELLDLLVI